MQLDNTSLSAQEVFEAMLRICVGLQVVVRLYRTCR